MGDAYLIFEDDSIIGWNSSEDNTNEVIARLSEEDLKSPAYAERSKRIHIPWPRHYRWEKVPYMA